MSSQQNNEIAKSPKRQFRINFYGFLLIVALLVAAVSAFALRMQGEVQSYREAKQAQRASVADVKAESKKIDAVWQSLAPTPLLRYTSAEKECIKKEGEQEYGTCLPESVYARLQVTSHESVLAISDALAAHLEQAGWQQRSYFIKTTDAADKKRSEFQTLPANFQTVRFSYGSPGTGDTKRCLSLIYSSKDAQTPGWNGYIGKCSS